MFLHSNGNMTPLLGLIPSKWEPIAFVLPFGAFAISENLVAILMIFFVLLYLTGYVTRFVKSNLRLNRHHKLYTTRHGTVPYYTRRHGSKQKTK